MINKKRIKDKKCKRPIRFSYIFMLILLVSLSFAQFAPSTVPTLRNVPWELTVLAAIFLSLSIIVLAYLISKVFGIKELSAWANSELYQMLMLSFLAFILFGTIRIENIIFEAYGFSPSIRGENLAIDNAKSYLFSLRSYLTYTLGGLIVEKNLVSLTKSSITALFSPISAFGFDNKEIASSLIKPFSSILETAITPFTVVYGVNSMQIYFLDFIERFAFNFLLPLGIFFRVFSFTRKFGNALIVLAIAFYIILPLSYLLNQSIVDKVLNFNNQGSSFSWKDIISARIGNVPLQKCDFYSIMKGDSSFSDCLKEAVSEKVTLSNIISPVMYVLRFVFAIFTEAAFAFTLFTLLPILNFTITIVIARELSSLLGSDISFDKLLQYL